MYEFITLSVNKYNGWCLESLSHNIQQRQCIKEEVVIKILVLSQEHVEEHILLFENDILVDYAKPWLVKCFLQAGDHPFIPAHLEVAHYHIFVIGNRVGFGFIVDEMSEQLIIVL